MTTKRRKGIKSDAVKFLEQVTGGSLTLGKLLYSIRMGDGISQVEFSKLLGISKAHLCDIEKERRVVGPARAWAWGKKLGYSQEQFVELAIQAGLHKDGLKYRVKLEVA